LRSGRRRSGTTLGRVDTVALGVQRTPCPSRVSCVRNVETVRHEALHDRAEVKGLRRRVVAATRLELRAA
jgi:hypothetical protein